MEVIAQYEEELKRVKEELHIYQRRERMNAAQSSPSPSCSTAVEPAKVAPKVINNNNNNENNNNNNNNNNK